MRATTATARPAAIACDRMAEEAVVVVVEIGEHEGFRLGGSGVRPRPLGGIEYQIGRRSVSHGNWQASIESGCRRWPRGATDSGGDRSAGGPWAGAVGLRARRRESRCFGG